METFGGEGYLEDARGYVYVTSMQWAWLFSLISKILHVYCLLHCHVVKHTRCR